MATDWHQWGGGDYSCALHLTARSGGRRRASPAGRRAAKAAAGMIRGGEVAIPCPFLLALGCAATGVCAAAAGGGQGAADTAAEDVNVFLVGDAVPVTRRVLVEAALAQPSFAGSEMPTFEAMSEGPPTLAERGLRGKTVERSRT